MYWDPEKTYRGPLVTGVTCGARGLLGQGLFTILGLERQVAFRSHCEAGSVDIDTP